MCTKTQKCGGIRLGKRSLSALPFPGRTLGFEAVPRGSSAAVRGCDRGVLSFFLYSAGKQNGDGLHSHTKSHNYMHMLYMIIYDCI